MDVVELLRSKNRCLERFLASSREFGLIKGEPSLEEVDRFEEERKTLLRALDLFDRKIQQVLSQADLNHLANSVKSRVRVLYLEKDELIQEIVRADDLSFLRIQNAITKAQDEVNQTLKGRETLGRFKSQQIRSGESLDRTL